MERSFHDMHEAIMDEIYRVYFQKLARQIGYRAALRAMRKAHCTREQCRSALSALRYCVPVR